MASIGDASPAQPPGPSGTERSTGKWRRRLARFLLVVSLLLNVVLIAVLSGQRGKTYREVLIEGERNIPHRIAVLPIQGLVGAALASDVRGMLEQLESDGDRLRGLILRIDSPGGTVTATDRIYHELQQFIQAKRDESSATFPVVAAIEGVGASGAYYIASLADEILVEPAGLTGSIGVRLTLVDASELTRELGVRVEDIKTGPFKDAGSPFRPLTPEERERFQEIVQHFFQRFLDVVRQGRRERLNEMKLDQITNGDVFVADEALSLGLVDQIGYFDDAIERTRELTGLDRVKVVELKRRWSWTDLLQLRLSTSSLLWSRFLPHEDPGVAVPRAYYLYGEFPEFMLWR